ncbi:MAG: hypothetical protein QOI73_3496 [Solirubrobacteraceae bacterium]|nr:hypothetical protein [Solirubrobacteraceae bacterium]
MPAWGHMAATAAKKVARSRRVRALGKKTAAKAAVAIGKAGASHLGRTNEAHQQREDAHGNQSHRERAYTFAREVNGKLSVAVFAGSSEEHFVVWKLGVPLKAFPSVNGDLASKRELAGVTLLDTFYAPAA